jgi:hypothetical protein
VTLTLGHRGYVCDSHQHTEWTGKERRTLWPRVSEASSSSYEYLWELGFSYSTRQALPVFRPAHAWPHIRASGSSESSASLTTAPTI